MVKKKKLFVRGSYKKVKGTKKDISMFDFFWKWFISFFRPILNTKLYPLPDIVEIYMGEDNTLSYHILKEVFNDCKYLNFIQIIPFSDSEPDDKEDIKTPKIWINDETEGVEGLFTICRYLGRLNKMHPSTPENALIVDGSLEVLQKILHSMPETPSTQQEELDKLLEGSLCNLEERLKQTSSPWIELDGICIADSCWYGALSWILRNNIIVENIVEEKYPRVFGWFNLMQSEREMTEIINDQKVD